MFIISLAVIALTVGLDQLTKYLTLTYIDKFQIIEVVKIGGVKLFSLTHVTNTGAAWSIMSGNTLFLIVLPIIAITAAMIYLYKIRRKSTLNLVSLSMVVGGGIGNLIDRIRLGEVVDFIKTDFIDFPIFNLADIFIVCGAIIFYINMLVLSAKEEKEKKNNGK